MIDTLPLTVPEDSSIVICDTTLNDIMADSVLVCGGGSNGMSVIAGNCITYTPNTDYVGNDTTCYVVCNDGVCDTTIVVITIGPGVIDTLPLTVPEDSSIVICDTTLNGLMADSVSVCGGGSNGMSVIAGTCITYTPDSNYIGNDTACYVVCNDGVCDTTIIVITVGPGVIDLSLIHI